MKCSKCGTPYRKTDHFCENCGAKIVKENQDSQILSFLKKYQKRILTILILFILFLGTCSIVNFLRSPEYISNQYFNSIIHQDTKKLINMIQLEDNDFFNETTLKEKMTDYQNAINVKLINKVVSGSEALMTYSYEISGKSYISNVSLSRTNDTIWGSWKVNSGQISKNIVLKFPKNSVVTIDDIDIKKYLDEKSSTDDSDIYKIDYMTTGEYQVKVTLEDGTEVSDTITISDNQSYSLGQITLKDEQKSKVQELAKNLMTDLYTGIMNDTSATGMGYNSDIQKIYKDLKYQYKQSNFKINQIEYTDLEVISAQYNSDSKLEVTFQTEYNYTITYNTNTNYSGTNRGYVTIVFDYSNNSYTIKNMENFKNNFPVRK